MKNYRVPLQDLQFVLFDVLEADRQWADTPALSAQLDRPTASAMLEEAAKLAQEQIAPLNRSGDEEGARWDNGQVSTPTGFKTAYDQFCAGGWTALTGNPGYGGLGMPKSLAVLIDEILFATNSSFALYPALSAGACMAIDAHASASLKSRFLPSMYAGTWAGSMCLTEPHSGSDLGLIRSRAEPLGDGTYAISGTKIFITGGEQDLTDNIIHLVLAKLPGAPEGSRGISLFLVPKIWVDDQGHLQGANGVSCGSIEHKMGIKGSATCVLNFDSARGFLIGQENRGLQCMFTMMNCERLSIGIQGIGCADMSYQNAALYAKERLQGRDTLNANTAKTNNATPADPILCHPDVRRMLLDWKNVGKSTFNQGYSTSVWWLNFNVRNNGEHELQRYLELAYAVLDYVDIYVFDGDKTVASFELGDMYPFDHRPVESRSFVVPLSWQPGQVLSIYCRIKTSTSVQAPLTLWQTHAFEREENNSNIAQGLYYGGMVVIAVYNLLIFLVLWERSYLFYVVFVLSLPLFMASISGQAFHYIWPRSVVWNDHSIPFFLGLAFASSAMFARRFLQVGEWSPWLFKGLSLVASFAAGCVVMSFFMPYNVTIHLLVPLGLFSCLFEMIVGGMAWIRGIPNARYYVVAWLAFLLGGVMLALNKLNVLPTNFFTEYSMQFGSVLEAVLLSFAMAERINVERRLRFEAQDETLRATRRLNEELEARVAERTRALEMANAKLESLSNTDQLTQLKNRRYLERVMNEDWQRCKRYGHYFAVMMMDVDFFKKVNDQYGHPAGDACLKQVAKRIESCIRWPSDQVARYGGEEFCMILPETDAAGARLVAERIRERIAAQPIVTAEERFSITISIGVCAGLPTDTLTADVMLRAADAALYQSKQAGRNQTTVHPSSGFVDSSKISASDGFSQKPHSGDGASA